MLVGQEEVAVLSREEEPHVLLQPSSMAERKLIDRSPLEFPGNPGGVAVAAKQVDGFDIVGQILLDRRFAVQWNGGAEARPHRSDGVPFDVDRIQRRLVEPLARRRKHAQSGAACSNQRLPVVGQDDQLARLILVVSGFDVHKPIEFRAVDLLDLKGKVGPLIAQDKRSGHGSSTGRQGGSLATNSDDCPDPVGMVYTFRMPMSNPRGKPLRFAELISACVEGFLRFVPPAALTLLWAAVAPNPFAFLSLVLLSTPFYLSAASRSLQCYPGGESGKQLVFLLFVGLPVGLAGPPL